MNNGTAIELARQACFNSIEKHDYTPKNAAEAAEFEPHLWVVEAIKLAYEQGVGDGYRSAVADVSEGTENPDGREGVFG